MATIIGGYIIFSFNNLWSNLILDSSSIELPGSEIHEIVLHNNMLIIRFSKAYIVKTMTGSVERTRWWQAGELIFTNVEVKSDVPQGQLVCAGGDIVENIYTYRDMIPIPFVSRGHIRCALKFKDLNQPLLSAAQEVRLQLEGVAKYIEHLRPPSNIKNNNE